MLYKFKQAHNTAKATKNTQFEKGESAINNGTVTRSVKKFHLGCKFNNQAKSSRPKNMDSKTLLQRIEANCASSTQRVSGKLSILQSEAVHHLSAKSIQSCQIMP